LGVIFDSATFLSDSKDATHNYQQISRIEIFLIMAYNAKVLAAISKLFRRQTKKYIFVGFWQFLEMKILKNQLFCAPFWRFCRHFVRFQTLFYETLIIVNAIYGYFV
jgi:hypothetical protein